jgi:hypothetical protein
MVFQKNDIVQYSKDFLRAIGLDKDTGFLSLIGKITDIEDDIAMVSWDGGWSVPTNINNLTKVKRNKACVD